MKIRWIHKNIINVQNKIVKLKHFFSNLTSELREKFVTFYYLFGNL